MSDVVEIQDIEQMRQQEGIDDVELRGEVRQLRAGDYVRLTFLAGPRQCETLAVRITSIRGKTFRGKLTSGPSSASLPGLHAGLLVVFGQTHIHSVMKRQAKKPEPAARLRTSRAGK